MRRYAGRASSCSPYALTSLVGLRIACPPHADPLTSAPGPLLSGGRLIHPPDTSMDVLAAWGGIRPYRDLPFPGLVDEPVADLKLHRQDSACGGLLRLALLLGSSGHDC